MTVKITSLVPLADAFDLRRADRDERRHLRFGTGFPTPLPPLYGRTVAVPDVWPLASVALTGLERLTVNVKFSEMATSR